MTTIYRSPQSLVSRPSVNLSQAGQNVTVRGALPVGAYLAAAPGTLSPGGAANPLILNDTIVLLKWPARTVISDLALDLDAIDNTLTPLAILQVGVMTAALTGLAGPVLMNLTAAQAKTGGVYRNGNSTTLVAAELRQFRTQASNSDRYLGVLVQTGPGATPLSQATAGTTVVNKGRWQASTAYALNDYLYLDNGQIVYVTTAGTSGTTEPNWASVKADTTTDGTVTWTAACPVIGLTATFRSAVFGG